MAERVGFEPTYRLITDNSISSRARYGLFATFPQTCVVHEDRPAGKPFFRAPAAEQPPARCLPPQTQQDAVRLTSIQPGSSRRVRSGAEPSCAAADSPPRAEKKDPLSKSGSFFQCLAKRRRVQTKRCRRSAQSGSLRRSSMSACSCAMSASSPSKRRS